ncbi:MAG: response regulator [Bacillota bacterium]
MPEEMLKVLVADDQPEIREVFEASILAEGHLAVLAKNGREAVDIARRLPPDVVFLDVKMPVLDGFGVLEELQKVSPQANIVMMSAAPEVETITTAIKKGAFTFLLKPFDMSVIRSILNEVLQQKADVFLRIAPDKQL